MANEKVEAILYRLQKKGALSEDDLSILQSTIDQLEQARASETHHETTSHHHTSTLLDISGIRDIGQLKGGK